MVWLYTLPLDSTVTVELQDRAAKMTAAAAAKIRLVISQNPLFAFPMTFFSFIALPLYACFSIL